MKYSCFGERLIQQVERTRQVILFGGELPLQPGNQVNVLEKRTYQICNTCIFLNNTHFVWKANIVLEKKILNQFIGKPVHYYLVFEGHDINVFNTTSYFLWSKFLHIQLKTETYRDLVRSKVSSFKKENIHSGFWIW